MRRWDKVEVKTFGIWIYNHMKNTYMYDHFILNMTCRCVEYILV